MEAASAVFVPRSKRWWTSNRRRRCGYHYRVSRENGAYFSSIVSISVHARGAKGLGGYKASFIEFQFIFPFCSLSSFSVLSCQTKCSEGLSSVPMPRIRTLSRPFVEAVYLFIHIVELVFDWDHQILKISKVWNLSDLGMTDVSSAS